MNRKESNKLYNKGIYKDLIKLNLLASSLLLSSGALATTFVFPPNISFPSNVTFPISENAKNFAPLDRQQICENFNAKVNLINRSIGHNNGEMSTNLCRFLSLSKGQLEDGNIKFSYINYDSENIKDTQLTEYVDVTREIELIILSQPNLTQYLFYADGDAVLRRQELDHYLTGTKLHSATGNQMFASYNSWLVGSLSGVFNNTNVKTTVTSVPEEPGKKVNSRYWQLQEWFPKTSVSNKGYAVSTGTSLGFSIGANGEYEKGSPSLGASIDFSYSVDTSISSDESVVNSHTDQARDDLGIHTTIDLNPIPISLLSGFHAIRGNQSSYVGDSSGTNTRLGQAAWKELDFSTFAGWKERLNSENCTPGVVRSMTFDNTVELERGQYDIEYSGNSAIFDHSDKSASLKKFPFSVSVNTQCVKGSDGKYFRVFESLL
ncbi:hypothetical protein MHO82_22900 [Vibrio sp. Of7-15]|uniref:hypothetical protein n=1 Tax=Vibrio sp. Of7-15 TaxID=2724879 RepID=UPI001EF165C1|nr:hypothetical protein [Vibrio sp. Of7-15]MCG7499718.1 hypothetical protein [Vibrio sp. Of7-15]